MSPHTPTQNPDTRNTPLGWVLLLATQKTILEKTIFQILSYMSGKQLRAPVAVIN